MLTAPEFRKYAIHHHGLSGTTVDRYQRHVQNTAGHYVHNMTRSVIEERPTRFAEIDVFSRLIMDRIIFVGTSIDEQIANVVTAQLLFLESADAQKDILMYVNSPGGSVYAGLGMYDTMQYVGPDVATICTGIALSFGAVLLCGGAAGKRSALPHARVMLHQPLGGVQGQAADIEITAREILKLQKELYHIISKHSGQDYDTIHKHSDRDYWLTAKEAKEYGLIDEVLTRPEKKK